MTDITLLTPAGRKGIRIKKMIYDSLKQAMLKLLDNYPEISSQRFFGILNDQFAAELGDNTGWYLYQVKLDMQARDILTTLHIRNKGIPRAIIKRCVSERKSRKYPQ